MRLYHVADAQRVDVCVEAPGEAAGNALAHEFGDGVGVHGVDVEVLGEGEGGEGKGALAEAYFVGGFRGGDDDFADAEFAGGFDYVVGACCVAFEAFVVLGGVC